MGTDAEEVAAVFDRAAPTYDTVVPFFARFGARLVELAGLAPGERVLDVGCGRGATLLPAARAVGAEGRVLGVDLSERMVSLLERDLAGAGLPQARVRRADATALDVGAAAFDVVLCSFVLHLLPDPAAAVAAIRRALRDGGRLAASAPSASGPHWKFLSRLFGRFEPLVERPVVVPARPEFDLTALLVTGGFEIVRAVDEQQEFVFVDEAAWWNWAWSAGMRALFEALPAARLDELRRAAFAELAALRRTGDIVLHQTARFVLASRPPGAPPS